MEGSSSSSSYLHQPMDASLSLTGLVEARRAFPPSSSSSSHALSAFNSPSWTPFFNGASGPMQSFWTGKTDIEDYTAFTTFESLSVDALLSADEGGTSSPASTNESETQQRTVPSSSLPLPAWNSSSNLRADAGFSLVHDYGLDGGIGDDYLEADDEAGANSDKEQGPNDVWFAPATTGIMLQHRNRRMALVPQQIGTRKASLNSERRRMLRMRSVSPFAQGNGGDVRLADEDDDLGKSVRQCVSAPELPTHRPSMPSGMPAPVRDETFGKVESRIDTLLAELGWSHEKANAVINEAKDGDAQQRQQQDSQQQQHQHYRIGGGAGSVGAGSGAVTSAGALFQRRAHTREQGQMPQPSPVVIPGATSANKAKEEDEKEITLVQQPPLSATLPFSSLSDTQKQRLLAELQASQISQQTAHRLGIFNDFVTPSQQFSGQDSSERAARAVQAALLYGMEGKMPGMSPGGQRRPSTASSAGSSSTNGLVTPITPFNALASSNAAKFHQQQRVPPQPSSLSTPSSAFHNLSMQDQALAGPSSATIPLSQTFAYEVPSAPIESQSAISFPSVDYSTQYNSQQQEQPSIANAFTSEDFSLPSDASTAFMTLGNSLGLSAVSQQSQNLQFPQQSQQDQNPAVIDSSSYGHIFGGMPHVQLFQQNLQMHEQQPMQQQQMQPFIPSSSDYSPKKRSPTKTRSSPNLRTTPPPTDKVGAPASTPTKSPRRIASNRRLTLSNSGGSAAITLPPTPKDSSRGTPSKADKHLRRHSHASLSSETDAAAKSSLSAGKFAFVNYGMEDAEELCSAVAPSGSYKVPLKGYGSSDEATSGAGGAADNDQQDDEDGNKGSKKAGGRSRTRTRTKSQGSLKLGPRWETVEEDTPSSSQHRRRQSTQQSTQQLRTAKSLQHFEPIPQLLQFQQMFFDVHGDEVNAEGNAMPKGDDDDDDDDEESQAQQNKIKRRKSVASLNKKASRETVGASASKPRKQGKMSTGA